MSGFLGTLRAALRLRAARLAPTPATFRDPLAAGRAARGRRGDFGPPWIGAEAEAPFALFFIASVAGMDRIGGFDQTSDGRLHAIVQMPRQTQTSQVTGKGLQTASDFGTRWRFHYVSFNNSFWEYLPTGETFTHDPVFPAGGGVLGILTDFLLGNPIGSTLDLYFALTGNTGATDFTIVEVTTTVETPVGPVPFRHYHSADGGRTWQRAADFSLPGLSNGESVGVARFRAAGKRVHAFYRDNLKKTSGTPGGVDTDQRVLLHCRTAEDGLTWESSASTVYAEETVTYRDSSNNLVTEGRRGISGSPGDDFRLHVDALGGLHFAWKFDGFDGLNTSADFEDTLFYQEGLFGADEPIFRLLGAGASGTQLAAPEVARDAQTAKTVAVYRRVQNPFDSVHTAVRAAGGGWGSPVSIYTGSAAQAAEGWGLAPRPGAVGMFFLDDNLAQSTQRLYVRAFDAQAGTWGAPFLLREAPGGDGITDTLLGVSAAVDRIVGFVSHGPRAGGPPVDILFADGGRRFVKEVLADGEHRHVVGSVPVTGGQIMDAAVQRLSTQTRPMVWGLFLKGTDLYVGRMRAPAAA